MLGSYMDDMGISAAQFEDACAKGKAGIKTQFQQMLFEQVNFLQTFISVYVVLFYMKRKTKFD